MENKLTEALGKKAQHGPVLTGAFRHGGHDHLGHGDKLSFHDCGRLPC